MRSKKMENINRNYEKISIEIIPLCTGDVITTSGAFNAEDDNTEDWF